jgi:hypothetical protein
MKNQPFWLKFFEVLCLFLVVIGLTQSLPNAGEWQMAIVTNWTKIGVSLLCLIVASGILAFLWQKSGKGEGLHGWFQDIIAFYVAYEVMRYGASKLLKTQLQPPHFVLETPFGDLSGFWLTWAYHGYSPTFAFLLGAVQVGGSILLLFRKTRLIGVFVLLPVLVNIDLINQFYAISPLAYYNSLHYTFILLFFMFLDYEKLKAAFLSYPSKINFNWQSVLLNVARIGVVAAAFWTIQNLKDTFQPKTKLNGVWQVQTLTRHQKTTIITNEQDSVWSKIYFEWRYGCVFKYHPDKFQTKDLKGQYTVDEQQKTLKINLNSPKKDSMMLNYAFETDSMMTLKGIYQSDSLQMALRKIK